MVPDKYFERFTDRSLRVLQLAEEEARRLHHEYVGTEHILLGLIAEEQGVGAQLLKQFGVTQSQVRREAFAIVQTGPVVEVSGDLPYTPGGQEAIVFAVEEAHKLNNTYVGTEHLLLGLVRADQGVAFQVLLNMGLNLRGIRESVLNLLGHSEVIEPAIVPTDPNKLNPHLPDAARAIAAEFAKQIDLTQQQQESAVGSMDIEKAARIRDLIDSLNKLRDEFISNWPKNI